jgi:predicted nucleic acid-binding protein
MFQLLPDRFFNRILPADYAVALKYGEMQGRLGPLPVLDAFIASTASVHRLTVVSHNAKDLARTGVPLLDPWH